MFASDSTCCKCNEPGKSVQIHHIDNDPTNNVPENLAVLCFQCHDDTQIVGGFGRKLNAPLVTRYRDEWHKRIVQRRDAADRLAVARVAGEVPSSSVRQPAAAPLQLEGHPPTVSVSDVMARHEEAMRYVEALPDRIAEIKTKLKDTWDSGSPPHSAAAHHAYVDTLEAILVALSRFFASGAFDDDPRRFFADEVAAIYRWHNAIAEPGGPGTGGTILRTQIGFNVRSDVERRVQDVALSLVGYDEDFDHDGWMSRWKAATAADQ